MNGLKVPDHEDAHSHFITQCCTFFRIEYTPHHCRRVSKIQQDDGFSCGVFACINAINHFDDSNVIDCNPIEYRITMALTMLHYLRVSRLRPSY